MPIASTADRSEWSGQAILAPGLFAGVIFCASVLLAMHQSNPGYAVPVEADWDDVFSILAGGTAFLVIASVAGLILSAIPILIGVASLAAVGRWNIGTRHYAFWALTGGGLPASVILGTGAEIADPSLIAFALTGAACAALARRYVRWSPIEE